MRVNSITLGRWFHWVRLNITSKLICISENTTYVQQFRAVLVFGVLLSVLVAVWDTVLMKIILLINSVSIINRKGAVLLGPSSLKWETFSWAAIRGHQILIYQTLWPTYIAIFCLNTVFSLFYRYLHFFLTIMTTVNLVFWLLVCFCFCSTQLIQQAHMWAVAHFHLSLPRYHIHYHMPIAATLAGTQLPHPPPQWINLSRAGSQRSSLPAPLSPLWGNFLSRNRR